jgi:hypothetical protein
MNRKQFFLKKKQLEAVEHPSKQIKRSKRAKGETRRRSKAGKDGRYNGGRGHGHARHHGRVGRSFPSLKSAASNRIRSSVQGAVAVGHRRSRLLAPASTHAAGPSLPRCRYGDPATVAASQLIISAF